MSTYVSCPSWTFNNSSQTPCEVVQELDKACTCAYTTYFPPYVQEAFIPSGSNVTACTCSWATYNLLSACMFCASSSPSLVSWDEWTTNCPTSLISTSTFFPSDAGVKLPLNTSIPCYARYNPRSWPNEIFNEETASSIAGSSNLNSSSCASTSVTPSVPVIPFVPVTPVPVTPSVLVPVTSVSVTSSMSLAPSISVTPSMPVTPSVLVTPSTSSTKTPVGAIAGGVVGGVFLLLLACGGVVFAIRRRRRRTPKSSPEKANSTWNSVNDSGKNVYLAAPGDSLSVQDPVVSSTPLDAIAIAEKHPVATAGPVQALATEYTGNGVRDAHSANLQSLSELATEMVRVPESEVPSQTLAQAVESAPIEAKHGELVGWEDEVAGPHLPPAIENTPMHDDRGELVDTWNEGPLQPVSVAIVREHIDSHDRGPTSISNVVPQASQHEVERIGNILTRLYIEDSRPTESDIIVHRSTVPSMKLKTVSQEDAEAVESLLASERHMIMPSVSGLPRSSPLIEAKKAPVSEDFVRRMVYTYLVDPASKQNMLPSHTNSLKLDLLFILDLTASQGPYIDNVKASINTICADIRGSDSMKSARPGDLRVAFIGFRDHPPQDRSFVTTERDFESDIARIRANLMSLPGPQGGGDGPEAVSAALDRALKVKWRDDCNKVAVLISDAPPHGIGSEGDFWPGGVPNVPDPLDIAREMLNKKITLNFIACEPSLSRYRNALDFYRGITRITSGIVIPLLDAKVMATCIIGSALERLAIQNLISEYWETLEELVPLQEPPYVVHYLHALMRVKGQMADQLIMENIYATSGDTRRNVEIWSTAHSLAGAKARLNES